MTLARSIGGFVAAFVVACVWSAAWAGAAIADDARVEQGVVTDEPGGGQHPWGHVTAQQGLLDQLRAVQEVERELALLAAAAAERQPEECHATLIPTVGFDDVTAPCTFPEYEHLVGLHECFYFFGGGAILNECSGFAVPAFSSPDFLAFNPITENYLPELILGGLSAGNYAELRFSGGTAEPETVIILAVGRSIEKPYGGVVDGALHTTTPGAWSTKAFAVDAFSAEFIWGLIILGIPHDVFVIHDVRFGLNIF